MFCSSCGAENQEGKKFCSNCGADLGVARPVARDDTAREDKKKAGGFWKSGAGIALIVIIGLAVLAGITSGIVLIARSGGSSSSDELTKIWEEYEDIASEAEAAQAKITMDPTALNKARADLEVAKKKASALQDVLAKTKVSKPQQQKYVQLKETVNVYDKYAGASIDLYTTLADAVKSNTVAAQQAAIDARIQEIKDLLSELNDLMDEFLANNDAVTAKPTFDPEIMIDTIDDLGAEIEDATGTTTGGEKEPETTAPEPTKPSTGIAGTYVGNGGSLTLNSDGTCVASSQGVSVSGTYTVSGNTITFTSSDGVVDTGTIEGDGAIILQGVRLTKQ